MQLLAALAGPRRALSSLARRIDPETAVAAALVCLLALALLTGSAQAETGDRLAEAYRIPQDARGLLVAKVESVEFLKDNEYSGGIQKGYTLPGFRLSPRLIFFPHDNIKLEAGAYLLRYWVQWYK